MMANDGGDEWWTRSWSWTSWCAPCRILPRPCDILVWSAGEFVPMETLGELRDLKNQWFFNSWTAEPAPAPQVAQQAAVLPPDGHLSTRHGIILNQPCLPGWNPTSEIAQDITSMKNFNDGAAPVPMAGKQFNIAYLWLSLSMWMPRDVVNWSAWLPPSLTKQGRIAHHFPWLTAEDYKPTMNQTLAMGFTIGLSIINHPWNTIP